MPDLRVSVSSCAGFGTWAGLFAGGGAAAGFPALKCPELPGALSLRAQGAPLLCCGACGA